MLIIVNLSRSVSVDICVTVSKPNAVLITITCEPKVHNIYKPRVECTVTILYLKITVTVQPP